jgi:biotin carboxyl carrier protein
MIVTDESGTDYTVDVRANEIVVNGRTVPVRRMVDGSVRVGVHEETVAWVAVAGETRWTFVDGEIFTFTMGGRARRPGRSASAQGSLTAPMPATVIKVNVKPGDPVRAGEVVVLLEAMKMELPVRSPAAGRVTSVNCREGELVQAGMSLVDVEG